MHERAALMQLVHQRWSASKISSRAVWEQLRPSQQALRTGAPALFQQLRPPGPLSRRGQSAFRSVSLSPVIGAVCSPTDGELSPAFTFGRLNRPAAMCRPTFSAAVPEHTGNLLAASHLQFCKLIGRHWPIKTTQLLVHSATRIGCAHPSESLPRDSGPTLPSSEAWGGPVDHDYRPRDLMAFRCALARCQFTCQSVSPSINRRFQRSIDSKDARRSNGLSCEVDPCRLTYLSELVPGHRNCVLAPLLRQFNSEGDSTPYTRMVRCFRAINADRKAEKQYQGESVVKIRIYVIASHSISKLSRGPLPKKFSETPSDFYITVE
ncbi:hypothetical protein PGTUg99_033979 [Puccinia graminis f. sp. tritici]|uniref:Uncharacterized protein n=1 Tax=Puccinia graminis f. sp. tritici TaxID=56615 RepID=A0A5B0RP65_PUCGR|nr:hypothetical protein PGTUg99_033979 [Puccinia graminis f. sp. tritici]